MTMLCKKGVAINVVVFLADSADGKTGKTGATITATISKDGGAFAAIGGSVTELTGGNYKIALNTTDTNTAGGISLRGTASGADPIDAPNIVQVVEFNPFDTVRLGLTALPNAAAEAAGGLYTRGTGAGQINQPANGMVDANAVRHLGTAYATPATAGIPKVEATLATDAISAASISSAAVTKIVAGVVAYSYRSGRTVLGLLRRLGSSLEVVTGLNGTTATFKQPDGTTTEFTVTQDITNGARTAVNVTNSETP